MTKLKKINDNAEKTQVVVHKWCSGCWIRENGAMLKEYKNAKFFFNSNF